ncbi:MAG: hypothetical protein RJB13_249 [Pseudomonadota bacterium]
MSLRTSFFLKSTLTAVLCVQAIQSGAAFAQDNGDEQAPAASEEATEAPESQAPSPDNSSRLLLKKKKKSVLTDKKGQVREPKESPSIFFPHWQPEELKVSVRPVIGLRFLKDSASGTFVSQGEVGGYAQVVGIPLVQGNPGAQIAPEFGFAVGQASVARRILETDFKKYERVWGGAELPVYYKFLRQSFRYRLGVVSGGPLPEVRRSMFQSDSGVAIIPHVSVHYTLTVENSEVKTSSSPTQNLETYDHWITGRFGTKTFNFFIHAGPGFTTSSQESEGTSGTLTQSETYLLARTGADLIPKFGLEGTAKYVISSETDQNFRDPGVRSPLEELGAGADQLSFPEDSLHASVFFGFKKLFVGFGVGYTYSLKILNMSERDGTKRERTTSNGVGIVGNFEF